MHYDYHLFDLRWNLIIEFCRTFFLTIHIQVILDLNINLMKLCPVQQAMLCSCWNLQVSWLGAGLLVIDAGDARFKDLQQLHVSGLNRKPTNVHAARPNTNIMKYIEILWKQDKATKYQTNYSTSRPQSPYISLPLVGILLPPTEAAIAHGGRWWQWWILSWLIGSTWGPKMLVPLAVLKWSPHLSLLSIEGWLSMLANCLPTCPPQGC